MAAKIVCDSSANVFDLPQADLVSAPLKIICENQEFVDDENLDLPGMLETLKKTKSRCSTSCPNVHDWLEAFKGADEVYAVTITSKMSGSHSACEQAAHEYERKNPSARVFVIDSYSTGPEMQLILEKLRDLILKHFSFDQIRSSIREYMKNTHLLFSLQSLTNLARNGRVSPAIAKITEVLGIRVVGQASPDGEFQSLHKCRGEKRAMSTIFSEMIKKGYEGGKARIAHCQNELSAKTLAALIKEKFPACDIEIRPCGALCSFYAEDGGLMIGYEG